jgi:hypothetical protein
MPPSANEAVLPSHKMMVMVMMMTMAMEWNYYYIAQRHAYPYSDVLNQALLNLVHQLLDNWHD